VSATIIIVLGIHKVDKIFFFSKGFIYLFISQLTLDEESENDESSYDRTSTIHSRNQTRGNLAKLYEKMHSTIQINIDPEEYVHALLGINLRREQEVCF
jgi:hypothetical protein